ncbi:MAG TPA: hypothetical protein VNO43_16680 [Candidatus Eisenbacteria bacterium]|nr:hypothetical protein [Candidatus Eisenbacteria bacterium]
MLKITRRAEGTRIVFELEGRLVGPWVDELKCCWDEVSGKQPLIVVLKEVTFIDERGKDLLREINARGDRLVGEGCMTRAIVEQIQRGGSR